MTAVASVQRKSGGNLDPTSRLSHAYCPPCDAFFRAADKCPRCHSSDLMRAAQPIPPGACRRLRETCDE